MTEVLGQHRSVKAHEANFPVEVGQKCRDITVATKNLWATGDQIQVQTGQKVICSVSAACTEDRLYLGCAKHLMQLMDATLGSTGEIEFAIQDGLRVNGVKP